MPIFSESNPVRKPVVVDGDTYFKSEWLNAGNDPAFSPTIFLVEQAAFVSLRPHFHRNNQFQLFVRGSGTIGRHALGALMVHYAGAYTGYGPIVAGPEGLAYLTLRSVHETGSTPTQDTMAMKRGPKLQLHGDHVQAIDPAKMKSLTTVAIDTLIPLHPTGVAAVLYTLPPQASVTTLDPAASAGQFFTILAGTAVVGGEVRQRWDSHFVAPDEPPVALSAGDEGAQFIVMQLPHRAAEYG